MCSQPSRIAAAVSVRPAPIAVHHQVAAHQDLAVLGDAQLDAVQRRAHGLDADRVRRVGADHRPGLGLAIALHQRECRAPGRTARPPAPAARRRTSRRSAGRRTAPAPWRAPAGPAAGSSRRSVERQAPAPRAACSRSPCARSNRRCCQAGCRATCASTPAADHLQHARHRGQDGRAHRQHVGRQVLDAARVDDLGADARAGRTARPCARSCATAAG